MTICNVAQQAVLVYALQPSAAIEFVRRSDREAYGARLESVCTVHPVPRVRIPPSPPLNY